MMKDKNNKFVEKETQRLQEQSDKLRVKYKDEIIGEEEAIKIALEYRQNKEYVFVYDEKQKVSIEQLKMENYEYGYAIDWGHPRARVEFRSLKKNGALSNGFGKKVLIWHVWFVPLHGVDFDKGVRVVGVDIDAKTGEVFTKYSMDKL
ncbi:MAG: hypothetical protein Q8Q08_11855 [Candidatus Omnitrophota bacterium]|nr:hypothetical protein [Candidatus Omnitrophota bacterium]